MDELDYDDILKEFVIENALNALKNIARVSKDEKTVRYAKGTYNTLNDIVEQHNLIKIK